MNDPDRYGRVVEAALMRVANNVAKHIIQRDGWTEDDTCFQIDLRQAQAEILAVIAAAREEIIREALQEMGVEDAMQVGLDFMYDCSRHSGDPVEGCELCQAWKKVSACLARIKAATAKEGTT